jgi:ubiquinone/menaquinone biosynthesis C-methylase UbiE
MTLSDKNTNKTLREYMDYEEKYEKMCGPDTAILYRCGDFYEMYELPFKDEEFDLICAFDVIEHVEDDLLGIREMKRVCKNEGLMVLTVPAYMFLWSHHDEVNQHYRRYTLKNLKNLGKKKTFYEILISLGHKLKTNNKFIYLKPIVGEIHDQILQH